MFSNNITIILSFKFISTFKTLTITNSPEPAFPMYLCMMLNSVAALVPYKREAQYFFIYKYMYLNTFPYFDAGETTKPNIFKNHLFLYIIKFLSKKNYHEKLNVYEQKNRFNYTPSNVYQISINQRAISDMFYILN